ncbi:hypothetical protein DSM104443_03245 [Usitatibacter rugosus]|uniref:DUF2069 domain-containing protein n=1 Tax=Usitatibacter rugosus TaxID=2732067 RepID=A0A6M4GXZ7_9PROT|nr:DUF2069 domain-containing protein [Usitatibacter rugosus]QJR12160.1 hypothetical protein DSM104443_03245 [Usitatibacter rugosus]
MKARTAYLAACFTLVSLIFLCVAWELWLAPLRPGGSWLVLKVLPLLFPLFGILNGKRYTYQWSSLLVWLYVAEGVVRAWSDPVPAMRTLAAIEIALSLAFFAAIVAYLRASRTS